MPSPKSANCNLCNKPISPRGKTGYCMDCYRKTRADAKIKKWKETGDAGIKVATTLRSVIRDYILESQNSRCAICGIENSWQGQELKFVLDHIDGDASNNWESNLRLVCPNCDSQLPTFKSKNKNSARSHRREE